MGNKLWLGISLVLIANTLSAQKKVSELMLGYDVKITTGNKEPKMADAFDGATSTIYIKGNMSRSDIVSALFHPVQFRTPRTVRL